MKPLILQNIYSEECIYSGSNLMGVFLVVNQST